MFRGGWLLTDVFYQVSSHVSRGRASSGSSTSCEVNRLPKELWQSIIFVDIPNAPVVGRLDGEMGLKFSGK
jgi:hypothetical protein